MKWYYWLIIGVVALIVLAIIMSAINRSFRRKYGMSLFGGGFLMLLAVGLCVGGYFLAKSTKIGYALFAAAAIILLIVLIYDFKKCGFGAGLGALILQIIFCAPSIFVVFDIMFNKGRSVNSAAVRNASRDKRARERNSRY